MPRIIKYLNDISGPTGRQPGADCKSGTTTCIANAACTEGLCACNDGHNLVEAGTCGRKLKAYYLNAYLYHYTGDPATINFARLIIGKKYSCI